MRTYDEIKADARPEVAFSNGTEGMAWRGAWCERCIHDGDHLDSPFCDVYAVAFCEGLTPLEWMEQPRSPEGYLVLDDQYHCIEFRDEDNGPGPEPQPIPDPPGQELLLPREPYEGVRMYGDATIRQAVSR